MPHITHIISDRTIGGAGIQLAHLCEALCDTFDIEVILPEDSALVTRLPTEGVRVTPFSFCADSGLHVRDINAFARYFACTRPCIVHTHAALSARLGAQLAGIKTRLSTRHCAKGSLSRPALAKRALYNACTTLTVATARAAARELLAEGVPEERIYTVQNGIPQVKSIGEAQAEALRRTLDLRPTDIVLGCCARLEQVKGQDLLLRAAARLHPYHPSLRVLLVGDGSTRAELQALAARLGVRRLVRFVGYVRDPAPYQNLFTLNILPSRGTETSCLALSECMSLGIPTVASDFGGNPDMIEHGVNGVLFRTDDTDALTRAIHTTLASPSMRRRMSEGAHRIYREKFTLQTMKNAYKYLYFSLMSQ